MSSSDSYGAKEAADLRIRFVIDRLDGQPILSGHADCPDCLIPLGPEPVGRMDLSEEGVRYHLQMSCSECCRTLDLDEQFEWGP